MKKIRTSAFPTIIAGVVSLLTAGMAFADNVYVTNNGNDSVSEISGGVVTTLADTNLDGPTGIAVYGNNLYVANNANPGTGYVAEFSLSGTYEGIVVGGLWNPRGIVFDSTGNMYVTNQSSGQIVEVPSGGMGSVVVSGLNFPNGITMDSSGNLFVTNGQGNSIDEIATSGGTVVSSTPTPFITTGLNNPVGIAYDSQGVNAGNLFVVDNDNTVLEFNATTGAAVPPTPFITDLNASDKMDGIAIDSSGDFYVTDNGDNSVTEYNSDGEVLNVYNTPFDFDGSCYVATSLVVPEPTTYAMMLGGLALLSLFIRRRQLSVVKL